MSHSDLEKRLSTLEIEIEGLKDENMYFRATLADLLQSIVEQSAISPDYIVKKLQDYQYAPFRWISKFDNPQMYKYHLAVLLEFVNAISIALQTRKKPLKDTETANNLREVQERILQELAQL